MRLGLCKTICYGDREIRANPDSELFIAKKTKSQKKQISYKKKAPRTRELAETGRSEGSGIREK